MKHYPIAKGAHTATLEPNEVWNVPDDTNEVRGSLKTHGYWRIPVSYRALAMDMHGRVFGIRTMTNAKQSGYDLEGLVSIEGRRYRAFTSSRLFQRPDGSLVDVAIVYVCGTPDYQWQDPLTVEDETERNQYLEMLRSKYSNTTYHDLSEYCRCLQAIADGTADKYLHCTYREDAIRLRGSLAPKMGWK